MDIDSAASTPIVKFDGDSSKVDTSDTSSPGLAYHLMDAPGPRLYR